VSRIIPIEEMAVLAAMWSLGLDGKNRNEHSMLFHTGVAWQLSGWVR
jgi:hypothetical protein